MFSAFIATLALKCGAVLLLTCCVGVGARRSRAAVRHLVWTTGLAASLVVPIAAALVPEWRVLPAAESPRRVIDSWVMPGIASATQRDGVELLPILIVVWIAGALVVLARIVASAAVVRRWRRRASAVTAVEWRAAIQGLLRHMPAHRRVRFLECDWIDAPCTWGTLHPIVLLPSAGAPWNPERRRAALAHELAHIRRFDVATQIGAGIACAVHWYNPLVWLAARSAVLAREQACDDCALAASSIASDYAGLLLELAPRTAREPGPGGALALAHASQIGARVRSVLDPKRLRAPATNRSCVAAALLGTSLVIAIAAAAPAPAQMRSAAISRPDSDRTAVMAAVKKMCGATTSSTVGGRANPARFTVSLADGAAPGLRRVFTVDIKDCVRAKP